MTGKGHMGTFRCIRNYILIVMVVVTQVTHLSKLIRYKLKVPAFNFFGYIPRSGIVGSYGNSVFKFLRNHPTAFHSCCTVLHSYHQYTSVPISLYILTTTFYFLLRKKKSCHPNGHEGGYIQLLKNQLY